MSSSWWYPNMDHTSGPVRGYVPNLGTDYTYSVYEAVKPGDDLFNAISSGGPNGTRDNMWLAGQPRVVYLAPGIYKISQTLDIFTDTVIMGDAQAPPTIQATAGFNGVNMILGGQDGSGNGGELHFSVQIKNVVLDTTLNASNSNFNALSWRVAQNCALENVKILLPSNTHTGISLGQGSTISVADVRIEKGAVGFHYQGHQQAQLKNFYFYQNTTGLQIDGGNAITVYGCTWDTVGNPIRHTSGSAWVAVIDAKSTNSGDFYTAMFSNPSFMIDNLSNDNPSISVVNVNGGKQVGGSTHIDTYLFGSVYASGQSQHVSAQSTNARPAALVSSGKFPIGVAPSYASVTASGVVNIKDVNQNGGQTIHGDGSTDETSALNAAISFAAQQGKIAFIPFGIYRVTDTLYIPPGSRIVGEAWSTISGYGSKFANESSPYPVVMVGKPGETGTAELQDLRFTVGQLLPGAIIFQINMAGNGPTDVAVYNSLITVGGTRDTEINASDEANARSAYTGLHLTSTSKAYIDNFWSWVADHSSDGTSVGANTAAKTGVLVEATKGTWLVGLGSEHWWLAQINLHNAQNVLMTFFQSEINYRQNGSGSGSSSVTAPSPFTPVSGVDPDFSWCGTGDGECRRGPAEFISGGSNISHYAEGAYNFFNGSNSFMNVIKALPTNFLYYGITTHQAQNAVRLPNGTAFGKDGGADGFPGAWGALVAQYRG